MTTPASDPHRCHCEPCRALVLCDTLGPLVCVDCRGEVAPPLHLRALSEHVATYRYVFDPDAAPAPSSSPTCRLCPVCGGRPLRQLGRFMVCDDCRVAETE